jgi:hypothetical protein
MVLRLRLLLHDTASQAIHQSISFESKSISFERQSISSERQSISFERRSISFEKQSINFARNNFVQLQLPHFFMVMKAYRGR